MQGSLLLAGYENGDVVFWELRRTAWEAVKSIKGATCSTQLSSPLWLDYSVPGAPFSEIHLGLQDLFPA